MVKHLVMFRLADEAEGKSKQENALIMKKELEALKEKIPTIRKIEVLINSADAPQGNFDLVLDSEFDTMDDMKDYIVHPEHRRVGQFIVKVRTERAAIDYEM